MSNNNKHSSLLHKNVKKHRLHLSVCPVNAKDDYGQNKYWGKRAEKLFDMIGLKKKCFSHFMHRENWQSESLCPFYPVYIVSFYRQIEKVWTIAKTMTDVSNIHIFYPTSLFHQKLFLHFMHSKNSQSESLCPFYPVYTVSF